MIGKGINKQRKNETIRFLLGLLGTNLVNIDATKTDLDRLNKRKEPVERNIRNAETQLQKLKSELETIEADITRVEGERSRLEGELAEHQKASQEKADELEEDAEKRNKSDFK